MLSGFNTNYRHQGVLFHVQTEDSGRENPHVITHLFFGGNIIASVKRDYSQSLAVADLEATVRTLMEGQHKEMLKQLSRGEHNAAILQRLGADIFTRHSETAQAAPAATDEQSTASELLEPAAPAGAAPAVAPIVAAEQAEPTETTLRPAAARNAPRRVTPGSREFGDSVVSEKPLDEVVLDYLVENARKRKRTGK